MRALQICSYYMDSKLYGHLIKQLDQFVDNDVFYFTDDRLDISTIDPSFYVSHRYKSWERLFFYRKHKIVYEDLLRELDPRVYTLTHAHSLMSNGYISYKLKEDYGVKYVTAVRRSDLFAFMRYKPYLKPLAVKILEGAEQVIFLSPVHRQLALKMFKNSLGQALEEKSITIPNGIDPIYLENQNRLSEAEQNAHLAKKPVVIFVGKIDDPNKNIRNLVRALDFFNREEVLFELHLVGRLEDPKLIDWMQSKKFIQHIPPTDAQGVIRALRSAHIFAMPSFTETFGLVYPEAMSQGLPVIYSKGQGIDGYFPEGQIGQSVNPHSVDSIRRAIAGVYTRLDELSPAVIDLSSQFSWEQVGLAYRKIYEKVGVR